MAGQRLASKQKLGTRDLQAGIDVVLNLLVIPSEDWDIGVVLERSSRSKLLDLLEEVRLQPVVVGKDDTLGRAFLARAGEGVLVRLPSDVVDV